MSSLIDTPPSAVQYHEGSTNFYFGVHPHKIQYLPAQAEFTVVYSPKDGDGWQSVGYRIFPNNSGIAVTSRSDLAIEEITYFETLAKNLKHDTGTVPAVGRAGV